MMAVGTGRPRRGSRHVAKLGIAILALLFAVGATPSEVAPIAARDGFYIDEQGTTATNEGISRAVADARNEGGLLYIVVLADDPAGGAVTFAGATLNELPNGEGTVLVISPGEVGWEKNNSRWTIEELNEATEVSLDGATDDEVAQLFVASLLGEDTGGGGSGFLIFLGVVLLLGLVVAFVMWRSSRANERRTADALAELKAKAQGQIDAVANDILEDEDEVAEAGNAEASAHFDRATSIYSNAADRLTGATSPHEVVKISADLDEAIWHLDCAEAILDGNPLPPKPAPPKPPPPAPVAPAPSSQDPGTTAPSAPPLQPYHRRSERRSSYGADDMLKTVLAMQAMRSLGGSSARRSSRTTSSSKGSSAARSPGRARGGGRRRR